MKCTKISDGPIVVAIFFIAKLKSLQIIVTDLAWGLCSPFQAYLGENGSVQAFHGEYPDVGLGSCQLDAFPQSHSSFLKKRIPTRQ